MSLYEEAAQLLENPDRKGGTLKSRTFAQKGLRNQPKAVYALAAKATVWSAVLKDVIERSGLLEAERKLAPYISLVLVHDLILSKNGVAAPKSHPRRLAVEKHQARLTAEFTKLRVKRGFAALDDFRAYVEGQQTQAGESSETTYPRWVRINTLKTTFDEQRQGAFAEYRQCYRLSEVLAAHNGEKIFFCDINVPDLLAVPRYIHLSKSQAYGSAEIILQDKASCFPSYLLDVCAGPGDVIDACAAPGNKTTQLAAFLGQAASPHDGNRKVFAFERDRQRTGVLRNMVKLAGADELVEVIGNTDFTSVNPDNAKFRNVTAILLDPSCSGSGIIGRDDEPTLSVPERLAHGGHRYDHVRGQPNPGKRKRAPPTQQDPEYHQQAPTRPPEATEPTTSKRLEALSHFQLQLLLHAMRFPSARRIAYSTCSIHAQENESVVLRALLASASNGSHQHGWRLLARHEQVSGLASWRRRGDRDACREILTREGMAMGKLGGLDAEALADACLRCEKGTADGTMGFFVAAFVRDSGSGGGVREGTEFDNGGPGEDEDEWEGFSDGENR